MIRTALLTSLVIASTATAASNDGNVEWQGVNHIGWQDRLPLVPIDGEGFQVRFQSYRNDLTSAGVRLDNGTFIPASVDHSRGPYDIWTADIPATTATTRTYSIELSDGGDTDFYSEAGMTDTNQGVSPFVINYDTLEHAPVGCTPATTGVVFKLWAPNSTEVYVEGSFNGGGLGEPMTKVGDHFIRHARTARLGQQYRYFFADTNKRNTDPRARRLNPTNGYASYILSPTIYQWQSEPFSPPAFEDMVIYQLHVGSFAGRNDPRGATGNPSTYRDVANRVDHLVELGINTVLINPVNEFPGDFSGGYNPISMFAWEWRYGSPDDLKFMIDTLHANGIAVLHDIVWNHVSFSDNFLFNFNGTQLYFNEPPVETPWGAQANLQRDGVRQYFLDSIVYMFDEFRMDGIRMDATSFMSVGVNEAAGWSLMQEMNDLIDNRFADKIAIAEQLPDNPWITRPTDLGGAGFDSQYWDVYTDDLRAEVFGAAFGSPNVSKIASLVNGGGQYLERQQVTNYFELHDEAWSLSGGERAVRTINPAGDHDDQFARGRTNVAHGWTLLSPGIPAFLMGCEFLADSPFEQERLDWGELAENPGVFEYFKRLVDIRTGSDAFDADAYVRISHVNEGADVIAMHRRDDKAPGPDRDEFLVVMNLSDTDWGAYRLGFPLSGTWREVLNSERPEYQGDGPVNTTFDTDPNGQHGFAHSAEVQLPARSIVVFTKDGPSCFTDLTTTNTNPGDLAYARPDGISDGADLTFYVEAWLAQARIADFTTTNTNPGQSGYGNRDGVVDGGDLSYYVELWLAGCI